MLFRRVLACLAGVAVLLAVGLSGTGTPADAASETTVADGAAQKQSKRQKSRPNKSRKRCRAKQRRLRAEGRTRRAGRKRPCRRAKRSPRRIRRPAPTPAAPGVPASPPGSAPVAPVPPAVPIVPSASCASADSVPTAANLPAIRSGTLCLVNAERTSRGLAPLADNGQLGAAAQGHADDMVARSYFSHTSADGRSFGQRIRNAGYAGGTLAENIAWGGGSLGTPRRIVSGWMNSGGHRANILSAALRDSGIGVAPGTPQGPGGGTYVHAFGAQ